MSVFSLFAFMLTAGVAALGVAALVALVALVFRGRTDPGQGVES